MKRRTFLAGTAASLAASAVAQSTWPHGQQIKIIVPFPAGAANDAMGRLAAQALHERLGATTIVENRAGGSASIGTTAVLNAAPDGYTLLASAFNHIILNHAVQGVSFDPHADFETIGRTARAPLLMVMAPTMAPKTIAEMVAAHGLTFIGPSAAHIRMMGDKIAAKEAMAKLGVPLVPGSDGVVADIAKARDVAAHVGYPVLIKASAGGGGRGMKVARSADELEDAFRIARTEARAAFGNDAVYMEKYLDHPRHIELQILADGHGNVVHFGERDCSLQRRHQKLLEEAGSPALDAAGRDRLGATATAALRKLGYRNAGTLEFLYQDGQFAFIEMNTRLQVEHPITEMVCGIDLVREQIRIAAGAALGYGQSDIMFTGHAIECRINAEDPSTFMPTPGRVTAFHAPGGLGVRVDSALYAGYFVPPYYDSLVAKLIVHAPTRADAINRMGACPPVLVRSIVVVSATA